MHKSAFAICARAVEKRRHLKENGSLKSSVIKFYSIIFWHSPLLKQSEMQFSTVNNQHNNVCDTIQKSISTVCHTWLYAWQFHSTTPQLLFMCLGKYFFAYPTHVVVISSSLSPSDVSIIIIKTSFIIYDVVYDGFNMLHL